jgi:hypothetical protein
MKQFFRVFSRVSRDDAAIDRWLREGREYGSTRVLDGWEYQAMHYTPQDATPGNHPQKGQEHEADHREQA